jgi:hypothetical protein
MFESAKAAAASLLTKKPKQVAAKRQKRGEPQPPTVKSMLWDLAKSIQAYIASPENVSQEAYEKRLAVCGSCQYRNNSSCQLCGCQVQLKALVKVWHCPAFKWEGDVTPGQVRCIILLTAESEKQTLVEMVQAAARPAELTVMDCLGTYVPFATEQVIRAANWYEGMRALPEGPKAYAFTRPHVRGSNLLGGLLWVQQLGQVGIVMPVYAATRDRMQPAKQAPRYWRPIPSVSGDVFLITAETIRKIGWPYGGSDGDGLDWAMRLYSLEARLAGIGVGESWTCTQNQSPPALPQPTGGLQRHLETKFGRYWDMLMSDSRTRNVLPPPPPA